MSGKKQIAAILKQWMETYPQDFVDLGHAQQLLENYLTNTIEPYKKIRTLNAETYAFYQKVRSYTTQLLFKSSFDVDRFEFADLMIDPSKSPTPWPTSTLPLRIRQARRHRLQTRDKYILNTRQGDRLLQLHSRVRRLKIQEGSSKV